MAATLFKSQGFALARMATIHGTAEAKAEDDPHQGERNQGE